ncbi:uncharacterized protein LOC121726997 [Aricia agestis]|uniref:uncharacterized protein LOC121726997 n=1 Tax=Aricia agestis TaxID=91739 RepID=UPI001C20980E|nr:uncharacterized protein LOC121726997 [Aricia agestis]
MLTRTMIIAPLWALSSVLFLTDFCAGADIITDIADDKCRSLTSCSSCLDKPDCTWCVTKSLCTKNHCGNDNIIFPKNVEALMSGKTFCPRVVESNPDLTFKSGKKDIISVKITQIYLYMAFTPWKCKINLNGKETIHPAVLIADSVYCESLELRNESENPFTEGSVTVLWDYNKAFDGSQRFKVCRCDLQPTCVACK